MAEKSEIDKLCDYFDKRGFQYERNIDDFEDDIGVFNGKFNDSPWFGVFFDEGYHDETGFLPKSQGYDDGLVEVTGNLVFDRDCDIQGNLTAQDIIDRVEALDNVIGSYECFGMTGIEVHQMKEEDGETWALMSGNLGDRDKDNPRWCQLIENEDGQPGFQYFNYFVPSDEIIANRFIDKEEVSVDDDDSVWNSDTFKKNFKDTIDMEKAGNKAYNGIMDKLHTNMQNIKPPEKSDSNNEHTIE